MNRSDLALAFFGTNYGDIPTFRPVILGVRRFIRERERIAVTSPFNPVRRLVIAVIAFGTVVLLALVYLRFSVQRFDSNFWKSIGTNDPGRLAMVDDLLAKHRLVGMTRSEIDALLGTPPKTEYFSDYDYVYWLGPERGFISIDSEWLCIEFKEDVVVDARLMRD